MYLPERKENREREENSRGASRRMNAEIKYIYIGFERQVNVLIL
jgi:hypothetical protein